MSADIQTRVVPVGDDQRQHLELAHGPGKSGKTGSDGTGVVFLLDDPDTIAAKVRRAVTDPDPVLDYRPDQRPAVANLAVFLGALTRQPAHAALTGLGGLGGAEGGGY